MKTLRREGWLLLVPAILLTVWVTHLLSGGRAASAKPNTRPQPSRLAQTAETSGRAPTVSPEPLRAILCSPDKINAPDLGRWSTEGVNSVVLIATPETTQDLRAAIRQIRGARLQLYYWIEVARSPTLAAAHPEWMASLQGHPEWRRHFPKFVEPKKDEVVRNYPWVPIVYQEAFDAHLQRISKLLNSLPEAHGIFLNDLQSAPSACGCGNPLCRWTPGYGLIQTAQRLPPDAAARFASAVAALAPKSRIIPVWTTECEEMDKEVFCAGVGCFAGLCWKEYTAQLMPVASRFNALGVLLLYRSFGRDLPRYGSSGGWVKHALNSFVEMPPKCQGTAVAIKNLVPILQGWDVTLGEQQAQIRQSQQAGTGSYVMAVSKIDQGWEPRIVKIQESSLPPKGWDLVEPSPGRWERLKN